MRPDTIRTLGLERTIADRGRVVAHRGIWYSSPRALGSVCRSVVRPQWIVFPHYRAGSDLLVRALTPGECVRLLMLNAYNATRMGVLVLQVARLLRPIMWVRDILYGSLPEAIACLPTVHLRA